MNKKTKKYNALLVFILLNLLNSSLEAKTIIWDLGNTLFKVSKFGMAKSIGIGNFIKYSMFDWQNPKELPNLIFNILDFATPEKTAQNDAKDMVCLSPEGDILPNVMVDWLKGKVKSDKLINSTNDIIEKLDSQDYFISNTQKKLVKKTVNAMFNPEILAKNFKPIKRATKILKKCYNDGHDMIILSNFDSETFDYLYNSPKAQKVFQYFDPERIVISGDIGLIKPDTKIYKHVLKKFKLKASDCIFIDDQIENILAAEKLGIQSIHIQDQNYDEIKEVLNL